MTTAKGSFVLILTYVMGRSVGSSVSLSGVVFFFSLCCLAMTLVERAGQTTRS